MLATPERRKLWRRDERGNDRNGRNGETEKGSPRGKKRTVNPRAFLFEETREVIEQPKPPENAQHHDDEQARCDQIEATDLAVELCADPMFEGEIKSSTQ